MVFGRVSHAIVAGESYQVKLEPLRFFDATRAFLSERILSFINSGSGKYSERITTSARSFSTGYPEENNNHA